MSATIDKLQKVPTGNNWEEINDEIDDIMDDSNEKLENEINPAVESLLRHIRPA